MSWLEETDSLLDQDEKLLDDFNSFRNHLQVYKENVLLLEPSSGIKGIRCACFAHWLIKELNLQDVNIVMWVSSNMTYTTESGPWTRVFYQNNEGKDLKAVREICQHLQIPTENVLFLVPGDEFQREKIGEFVSHLLSSFDSNNHTGIVWFKCRDEYTVPCIKRMLL